MDRVTGSPPTMQARPVGAEPAGWFVRARSPTRMPTAEGPPSARSADANPSLWAEPMSGLLAPARGRIKPCDSFMVLPLPRYRGPAGVVRPVPPLRRDGRRAGADRMTDATDARPPP